VRLFGIPGRSYQLQRSNDLVFWPTIHGPVAAPPDAKIEFNDDSLPTPSKQFYRAVELP